MSDEENDENSQVDEGMDYGEDEGDINDAFEQEEEEDEEENRVEIYEEEPYNKEKKNKFAIKKEDRQTTPFLTKYEKARIIGARAIQISKNSPILIPSEQLGDETDPIIIAEMELREGKIPFLVRRYLPDGCYEDWQVKELKLSDN